MLVLLFFPLVLVGGASSSSEIQVFFLTLFDWMKGFYLSVHLFFGLLTYIGPDGVAKFGAFWPFFWLGCLSMKEYSVPQTLSNINSLVLLLQIKKCCVHAANL